MKPDFDQMARKITNMPVGLLKMRQPIADALRAAYAAGLERSAEIITTYDELDSATWRNVTTFAAAAIRAEKEEK